ncbi:MAG: DUF1846 domain-containing protein [Eubacteriaceae bacterium]|nr:DUF1846 domain-containing protein [Eubacteriaceae bacterium]
MNKPCFDNDEYIKLQSEQISKRISKFGGKLYLEFGGKMFDDYHASRVLPGFRPDGKVKMFLNLKEDAEIVIAISADDIERNKVRGDLGITYDADVLRLIDAFRSAGLYVGSVVITRYEENSPARIFREKLEKLGIKVYVHYNIDGYPNNIDLILSEEGFGKNDYIITDHSLIVVTAPGPGSGKMAVCLSQIYQDNLHGIKSGYAKFETFPVWNLPLKHPLNLAYEAATADLNDVNMIDPFHLEAYGEQAVNYNRDVEVFPILNSSFERIFGKSPYNSPTDMGVNMIGYCINDEQGVALSCRREIIRRYYKALCAQRKDVGASPEEIYKLELLMKQANVSVDERPVIAAAKEKQQLSGGPAVAIELPDGRVVTGKTSNLLGAASAALLNALKMLAGIDDKVTMISPDIISPIQDLKVNHMGNKNPRLHTDETLIALTICAANDETAKKAVMQLENLKGCEAHSTVLLSAVDENVFRCLGVNLTCEPVYQTAELFHKE